jgi:hypothetical protein
MDRLPVSGGVTRVANTSLLKTKVEPYVRKVLCSEYSIAFASAKVSLTTGGSHEFDAVSTGDRIVASIKSSSGKTRSENVPSGKIKDAEAELYYLMLVPASIRLLVLTNREFFDIMTKRLVDKLPQNIELRLISLPQELQEQVDIVQKKASVEVSPVT